MIKTFTRQFFIDKNDLATVGVNPYLILVPGYQLVLEGIQEGKRVREITTVLNKTKIVNGVKTRIVEERTIEEGRIAEISRNFFAISKTNNSVFYFGEDVDIFDRKGNVVSHEGSWRAGLKGARPGLIMPGIALVGARFFEEIAPGVALDKAEILSVTASVEVPVGKFQNVLKIRETTVLEPGVIDFKFFARGVGLIRSNELVLVKNRFVKFGIIKTPGSQKRKVN